MDIKFNGNTEIYHMNVAIPGTGLVQLYPQQYPGLDVTVGFEIITPKGSSFGKYLDYTTVYRRMDDGSVILSNDGKVWTPPPDPEPAEPYVPTLEEVKASKRQEVSTACEQIIYAGVDVALPTGIEHFSLTEKDQLNLVGKQAQLAVGAESLEYHQDGQPCRYYTAEEMQVIIEAAMQHVSYHTTYCNSLNMWIAGAESVEEVNTIYYGAEIPEEYQSEVLKDYLEKIMTEAVEVVDETVS